MSAIVRPGLWLPPSLRPSRPMASGRRPFRPSIVRAMGRLFNASGWIFNSSGGKLASSTPTTCCYKQAFNCVTNASIDQWLREDNIPASGVVKWTDGNCYYFSNAQPCPGVNIMTGYTAVTGCGDASCSPSPTPCNCPPQVGDAFCSGTTFATTYTVMGAASLPLLYNFTLSDGTTAIPCHNIEGHCIDGNTFPFATWDGSLSNTVGQPCCWTWPNFGADLGTYYCNSGYILDSNVFAAISLVLAPATGDPCPTNTCVFCNGIAAATFTSFWSLIINAIGCAGGTRIWQGYKLTGCTPAGVYTFCASPDIDDGCWTAGCGMGIQAYDPDFSGYTGNLTVA